LDYFLLVLVSLLIIFIWEEFSVRSSNPISSRVIDLKKLSLTLLSEETNSIKRSIIETLVSKFSKILLMANNSLRTEFAMAVELAEDIVYQNPETEVCATIPAGTAFYWPISKTGKTYVCHGGISSAIIDSNNSVQLGDWDCTDDYRAKSKHPQYDSLLGSLNMINLLLQHATNMDAYDGYISSSGAKAKYVGGFKMKLTNMTRSVELDRNGRGVGAFRNVDNDNQNVESCANCGQDVFEDEGSWSGDSVYCNECFDDMFVGCAECGETGSRDDMYWSEDSEDYLCDHHAFYCDWCSENFNNRTHSSSEIASMIVCSACYEILVVCQTCGSVIDKSTYNGNTCPRCTVVRPVAQTVTQTVVNNQSPSEYYTAVGSVGTVSATVNYHVSSTAPRATIISPPSPPDFQSFIAND
jgi:hypothetical protein